MDEFYKYLLTIGVGFVAGIINTLAGGGSLLTLPFLIFLGLPPAVANGTNRIGILLQSFFSIAGFKSKGIKPSRFSLYTGISALIGSLLGAQIAIDLNEQIFNKTLAVIMIAVVLFIVFKPKAVTIKNIQTLNPKYSKLSIFLFFFIGIYGGFIQAGVGILILFVLNGIQHYSLVQSNAIKVVVVGIYTVAALAIFIYNHQIDYIFGIILAIGNAFGGWFASRWSVKKGDRWIKILLCIMVCFTAGKLWIDS